MKYEEGYGERDCKGITQQVLLYLYPDTYREKYADFLKTDFPGIPFTDDEHLFKKLAEYGKRRADLHLMQSPELESPVVKFRGTGEKRVEKNRLS